MSAIRIMFSIAGVAFTSYVIYKAKTDPTFLPRYNQKINEIADIAFQKDQDYITENENVNVDETITLNITNATIVKQNNTIVWIKKEDNNLLYKISFDKKNKKHEIKQFMETKKDDLAEKTFMHRVTNQKYGHYSPIVEIQN